MPTETAPQAPVAAPVAAVTPSATPAAAPDRPINSITKKPITEAAHSLFKMLEETSGSVTDDEPEKPVAAAPAAAPAPAAREPEKPIKVSKKPVKRPDLPIAAAPVAPAPAAVAPAPAPAAEAVDSNWEDSLIDEEKVALEDARVAERVAPKHKGLADKMGQFFRAQKKYLAEHPDADNDDPDYQAILRQMPKLTATDKREIADARVEERLGKKYDAKYQTLEQELYSRDETPKIEQEGSLIKDYLIQSTLPKDMLDFYKAKGADAFRAQYRDELDTAGLAINRVVDDAKELLRITRVNPKNGMPLGEAATNPSHPKWEQHQRLVTMVTNACEEFKKNAPQSEQMRGGKWFVTRDEWAQLKPADRANFWTFTNSTDDMRQMIQRVLTWQPAVVAARLKARQEDQYRRGYIRQRPESVAPSAPPRAVSSTATPRSAPSPAPSAGAVGQLSVGAQLAQRLSEQA